MCSRITIDDSTRYSRDRTAFFYIKNKIYIDIVNVIFSSKKKKYYIGIHKM